MRFPQLISKPMRTEPADAETASHRLMLKAGMIHQAAAGEIRIMPYCLKCETNRNVVTNVGRPAGFPRDKYSWYCEGCLEGF